MVDRENCGAYEPRAQYWNVADELSKEGNVNGYVDGEGLTPLTQACDWLGYYGMELFTLVDDQQDFFMDMLLHMVYTSLDVADAVNFKEIWGAAWLLSDMLKCRQWLKSGVKWRIENNRLVYELPSEAIDNNQPTGTKEVD